MLGKMWSAFYRIQQAKLQTILFKDNILND